MLYPCIIARMTGYQPQYTILFTILYYIYIFPRSQSFQQYVCLIRYGSLQFTSTPDFILIYDDLVWIATIDAHKMPQSRHFGIGSDTVQQV